MGNTSEQGKPNDLAPLSPWQGSSLPGRVESPAPTGLLICFPAGFFDDPCSEDAAQLTITLEFEGVDKQGVIKVWLLWRGSQASAPRRLPFLHVQPALVTESLSKKSRHPMWFLKECTLGLAYAALEHQHALLLKMLLLLLLPPSSLPSQASQ